MASEGSIPPARRGPSRRILLIVGLVVAALLVAGSAGYLATTTSAPDVVGRQPGEATKVVTAAGFTVGARSEDFSDTVERGAVAGQSPAGGERVRKGGAIDLVISRGPAVTVPAVEDEPVSVAMASLKGLSLEPDRQDTASETIPEGQVMAQRPAPGTVVEEGTTVELVVSSGPPTVDMVVVLDLFDGYDSCGFSLGYYDIPGAAVLIEADGVPVGSGRLPFVGSDEGSYCKYETTIPDVPNDASMYSLSLGGGTRGVITSTRSELESADWTFSVSLGL